MLLCPSFAFCIYRWKLGRDGMPKWINSPNSIIEVDEILCLTINATLNTYIHQNHNLAVKSVGHILNLVFNPMWNLNECFTLLPFQAQLPGVRRRRPGIIPDRVRKKKQRLPLSELCRRCDEVALRVGHVHPWSPRRNARTVFMSAALYKCQVFNHCKPSECNTYESTTNVACEGEPSQT